MWRQFKANKKNGRTHQSLKTPMGNYVVDHDEPSNLRDVYKALYREIWEGRLGILEVHLEDSVPEILIYDIDIPIRFDSIDFSENHEYDTDCMYQFIEVVLIIMKKVFEKEILGYNPKHHHIHVCRRFNAEKKKLGFHIYVPDI